MSRRAAEQGAVNVGQGFPDYPIDPRLAACVTDAVAAGFNQYAPMEGSVALRAAIAAKIAAAGGRDVDPETELTVTCGGTESIYSAIQAVVGAGDEAIVFDPAYDAYDPAIRLAGGRCIHIPLEAPHFRYDWDRVRGVLSERTRLIVINNPHNPACTVAIGGRSRRAGGTHPGPAHRGARRRGLRTRAVRRPRAPVGHEPRRTRCTQLRGLFLRQDPAHHRLARRLLRGAAGADARAAQGAPVQRLQHCRAAAGGHRALSASVIRMRGARSRRSSAPSATCCARASRAAAWRCRRRRAAISSWPTIHRSAARSPTAATWNSPSGSSTRPASP